MKRSNHKKNAKLTQASAKGSTTKEGEIVEGAAKQAHEQEQERGQEQEQQQQQQQDTEDTQGQPVRWQYDAVTCARTTAFRSGSVWPHIQRQEEEACPFVAFLDLLRARPEGYFVPRALPSGRRRGATGPAPVPAPAPAAEE